MTERPGLNTWMRRVPVCGYGAGQKNREGARRPAGPLGGRLAALSWFPFLLALLLFFTWGCAYDRTVRPPTWQHSSTPSDPQVFLAAPLEPQIVFVTNPGLEVPSRGKDSVTDAQKRQWEEDFGDIDFSEENETAQKEKITIADPLEPFNRAMFHFNDRLYFWLLKPVAQGYRWLIPEKARIGIANFFDNIGFPVRFVNNLLQGNLQGAGAEVGRFTVNTIWGLGGFLDPAGGKDINLKPHKEDLGQTLGFYGLGPGFYINWPFFGPSSPRDTLGMVGDFFLRPINYVEPSSVATGAGGVERINQVSLSIGDYEALKKAAVDPYIAVRDAYIQFRTHRIRRWGDKEIKPGSFGEKEVK